MAWWTEEAMKGKIMRPDVIFCIFTRLRHMRRRYKVSCKNPAPVWGVTARGQHYSILVKYQVFAFSSFGSNVWTFRDLRLSRRWRHKTALTLMHRHQHVLMICTCCLFLWVSPAVTASPYGKKPSGFQWSCCYVWRDAVCLRKIDWTQQFTLRKSEFPVFGAVQ